MIVLCIALTTTVALPQGSFRDWGPEQAVGAPDTSASGDHKTAWASLTEDDQDEWLRLDFAAAVVPTGVRVFETYNPGALCAVSITDAAGVEHELWRGDDPVPKTHDIGVALIPLVTEIETRSVTLHLASSAVAGWNEIDAVGLHGPDGSIQWAVSAQASSTYTVDELETPIRIEATPVQPLAQLEDAHRTVADEAFGLFVDVTQTNASADVRTKLAQRVLDEQEHGPGPSWRRYAGIWSTNFGELTLFASASGGRVHGSYPGGTVRGTIVGKRLEGRYSEASDAGECRFEIDGDRLRGTWRPDGSERWYRWDGRRGAAGIASPTTWLVVLEAPWQSALSEPEYSFGEMLASIFERVPTLGVRQRFFTDETSFHRYCQEAGKLDGDVILSIAAHGDTNGIQSQDGMIDAGGIVAALEHMPNLRLVHFSSCTVMAGEIPEAINERLGDRETFPHFEGVSGYAEPADWMGSALCEFTYFELLIGRGLSAADAAQTLPKVFPLATHQADPDSPMPGLAFRFAPPGAR